MGARARWALLAVAGAIVCTICDHLHVMCGVLAYPHPVLWQQAWWVGPLFALSSVAMIAAVPPVQRALGKDAKPVRASASAIAADAIAFVTAYAFTAFGHTLPNTVTAVLVGFWVARVLRGVPLWLVVFALVTALVGPAVEASLSALGFFGYLDPDFLGVPRWLPALYLHAGLLAAPVQRAVLEPWPKAKT